MRKLVFIVLGAVFVILGYFTVISAGKAFRSDWQLPPRSDQADSAYRIVLFTQELVTPFWDKVGAGALEQADKEGARLEVWGSYGKNQVDFLKKVELAIHSRVDGIIVQGLDTDEFKQLTKIKAAFYGIPIITVANDVPMAESLRRTYVGSDQYKAGRMIAAQLLDDMGTSGHVVLMSDDHHEYYQKRRIAGIEDVLNDYPDIHIVYAETPAAREHVIATTRDVMNRFPRMDAFVAVNANLAGAIIQEIGRRTRVEPYHIYSFDDGSESLTLLMEGKLDGMIGQAPEMMGKISVSSIMRWLTGDTVPLDINGYLTDIRMLKATDL